MDLLSIAASVGIVASNVIHVIEELNYLKSEYQNAAEEVASLKKIMESLSFELMTGSKSLDVGHTMEEPLVDVFALMEKELQQLYQHLTDCARDKHNSSQEQLRLRLQAGRHWKNFKLLDFRCLQILEMGKYLAAPEVEKPTLDHQAGFFAKEIEMGQFDGACFPLLRDGGDLPPAAFVHASTNVINPAPIHMQQQQFGSSVGTPLHNILTHPTSNASHSSTSVIRAIRSYANAQVPALITLRPILASQNETDIEMSLAARANLQSLGSTDHQYHNPPQINSSPEHQKVRKVMNHVLHGGRFPQDLSWVNQNQYHKEDTPTSKITAFSLKSHHMSDSSYQNRISTDIHAPWAGEQEKLNYSELRPPLLEIANLIAAFSMGIDVLWLNNRMELSAPSKITRWVTNRITNDIPITILEAFAQIPNILIYSGFLIATIMFTGITLAWIKDGSRGFAAKVCGITLACVFMIMCTFFGATAEEMVLLVLPMSISLGMMLALFFLSSKRKNVEVLSEALLLKV